MFFFHLILFNLNEFNLIGFFVVSQNEKEKDVLFFQKSKNNRKARINWSNIISQRSVRVSISRQSVINAISQFHVHFIRVINEPIVKSFLCRCVAWLNTPASLDASVSFSFVSFPTLYLPLSRYSFLSCLLLDRSPLFQLAGIYLVQIKEKINGGYNK